MPSGRRKRWVEEPVKGGCTTITFDHWKYFHDYIRAELLLYEGYVFRGQSSSKWGLTPSLTRLLANRQPRARATAQQRHLEDFKIAVRGRRGSNPPQIKSDDDWWALGQHHGLATPLLDWTRSPFVALYFAFYEEHSPDPSSHRAVYAVAQQQIEEKAQEEADQREAKAPPPDPANPFSPVKLQSPPEVRFFTPMTDENARLISQNGLFSRGPDSVELETWVRERFAYSHNYIVIKLLIPRTDRRDCLRALNRMNINHLTLFPDLHGSSAYCNLHTQFRNY